MSLFNKGYAEQDSSAIWIDVRTAGEFSTGHHPEAVNIPYDVIASQIASVTEDKNADIRLYCRSGRRSGIAQMTLKNMGYTNVRNEGGVNKVMKSVKKAESANNK
ncbi:rhodanese-like domain-containing protein [Teredinibacter sp. KSP-S5-2]|uniref:rhodanese-like domain-containing protein n=1 Tax=Teredinibacter sp. KSP-S5-2 TaxID=3034506 RepID=UPI002934F1D4|nr:rhodanese-like domain-containing protein [Teredinibacter sp. KSP-S5-2]WNO11055.1 rhodanese-like domain-containing protein [Teredinibacter sp. KSP-S5-2]